MIQIISGPKGTGKTKVILEKVAEAVKVAKGNVVFITDKKINSSKIDFSVRCIYTEEYGVHSAEALRGFVSGLVAGNSDIEYLYIDGVMRIIEDGEGLDKFFSSIVCLEKEYGLKAVLSVSLPGEELPDSMKPYAV